MKQLAPLPNHIGPLRPDSVYEALRRREPQMWSNPSRCIICGGTGSFKHYDHTSGVVEEWECNCVDQWLLYVHLLNAGLPLGYQQLSWDDLDEQVPADVQMKILEYADQMPDLVRTGQGFVLRGPNGTGKTLLAALLLKSAIRQGYSGYFVSFHELLDEYTTGWKSDEAKYRFDCFVSGDFLVIDEMGRTGKGRTNVTGSMFDHIMRKRIGNRRPTMLTTNSTIEELRIEFGDTVESLLGERTEVLEVTGPDFRAVKAKQRTRLEIEHGTRRPVVLA